MSLGDGRDGWTPKPSLEISHGEFRGRGVPAVPEAQYRGARTPKEPRKGLTLANLAAFEASKRRRRHPNALRADVLREAKRLEATSEPYREAENAGQTVLFTERKP